MSQYDDEPREMSVPSVIGVIAACIYLLGRLVDLRDVSRMDWTDVVIAMLAAGIAWGVATLLKRALDVVVNDYLLTRQEPVPAQSHAPPAVSVEHDYEEDKSPPAPPPREPWEAYFDQHFNRHRARFGRRIVVLRNENLYDSYKAVAQARWLGKLDFISGRRLHDEADVNRFNGDAGELLEHMFDCGIVRRNGQGYEWTLLGESTFPVSPAPQAESEVERGGGVVSTASTAGGGAVSTALG